MIEAQFRKRPVDSLSLFRSTPAAIIDGGARRPRSRPFQSSDRLACLSQILVYVFPADATATAPRSSCGRQSKAAEE
jgi:hypothetical protein